MYQVYTLTFYNQKLLTTSIHRLDGLKIITHCAKTAITQNTKNTQKTGAHTHTNSLTFTLLQIIEKANTHAHTHTHKLYTWYQFILISINDLQSNIRIHSHLSIVKQNKYTKM